MKNRMTASEATSFERVSQGSMIDCLNHYKCGCKPYEDIFTFNRWLAQGYVVKRGERAYTLPLIKMVEVKDDDGALVDWFKMPARSSVFCRCQVAPLKNKQPETNPVIKQATEIVAQTPVKESVEDNKIESLMSNWTVIK